MNSQDIRAEDARAAAEIQADVNVAHIANVYAKGLLGASENAGRTDEVLEEFDAVGDLLVQLPKLNALLASARVSHDEKIGVLDRTLGSRISPLMMTFLKVVARHGRLDCLRAIHRQTHIAYDKLRGRVAVRLTTATPVSDEQAAQIAAQLRTALGGEPVLTCATDPALIGGAVLRVGDTVHDGSVARQLQTIREQMIDRSAHEIQSRRDRFRNSAGN